ncbi:MAG: hypothetical protein AAFN79_17695 [Pseudomonadota bacterium]
MDAFIDFATDNAWILLVLGVIAYIVGDEFFGFSKMLFGDDADSYGLERRSKEELEQIAKEAQRDFPDAKDTVSFDDMMGPGKDKR